MKIKEKIDAVKALFIDVDNTALYLKMYDYNGLNDKENGNRIVGIVEDKEWMKYNIIHTYITIIP